jgi:hypothetical protein
VADIDDEVDLAVLLTDDPSARPTVRRWLARTPHLRWAGTAALGALLCLIALINLLPLRRLLGATGVVVFVAATVSMSIHALAASRAQSEIERWLPAPSAFAGADPVVLNKAIPALARLCHYLIGDAAAAARGPLLLGALAGAALIVGALLKSA